MECAKFDPVSIRNHAELNERWVQDQPRNFIIFRPKKEFTWFEVRLKNTTETQERLASAGLDVMD